MELCYLIDKQKVEEDDKHKLLDRLMVTIEKEGWDGCSFQFSEFCCAILNADEKKHLMYNIRILFPFLK
jgi:hypothetical protein